MSFSSQIKDELNQLQIKSNCCKKAYILGAVLSASHEGNVIKLQLTEPSTAEQLCHLLQTIYKTEPTVKEVKRGCYHAIELCFSSKRLSEFLSFADEFSDSNEDEVTLNEYFHCQSCKQIFLRGAFCAKGSVSDPQKGYSFEIQLPTDTRAMLLHSIMEEIGSEAPGITARRGNYGIFYRNESAIEDILAVCGSGRSVFTFADALIEKDLRNAENRATNCVMKNIDKSVRAAAAQIEVIETVRANGMLEELPEEIQATAMLRLSHPEANLSELAELHIPAISKSGLNHRLQKITEFAKQKNLM